MQTQTLEIQLSKSTVGFDGTLNYKGEKFEVEGRRKSHIKRRILKLFLKKHPEQYPENIIFIFGNNNKAKEVPMKQQQEVEKKKRKVTDDVTSLPFYWDPILIAGDKAKFNYDKAQTDWAVVDILKVEDAHNGGFYIHWSFEHDKSKSFRTYVRKGIEVDYIVGSTITAAMAKNISQQKIAKPNQAKK